MKTLTLTIKPDAKAINLGGLDDTVAKELGYGAMPWSDYTESQRDRFASRFALRVRQWIEANDPTYLGIIQWYSDYKVTAVTEIGYNQDIQLDGSIDLSIRFDHDNQAMLFKLSYPGAK